MTKLDLATDLAFQAHHGQFRRDGKTPYINHPVNVMVRLKKKGEGEEVLMAAVLHDVLEESEMTAEYLLNQGIPLNVVYSVNVLTKDKDVDYELYLTRVKSNEIARKVKIADMLENLSDDPTEKQIKKYAKGLLFLM